MSDSANDEFLKDLQKQCLQDTQEYLDTMLEALAQLPGPFASVLKTFSSCIHSLKGNVQVAGFAHLARFLHDSESIIQPIDANFQNKSFSLNEGDQRALEFFLSELQESIKRYVEQLSASLLDGPEFYDLYKAALVNLTEWWKSAQQPVVSAPKEMGVTQAVVAEPSKIMSSPQEVSPSAQSEVSPAEQSAQDAQSATSLAKKGSTPEKAKGSREGSHSVERALVKDLYLVFNAGEQTYAMDVNFVVEIVNSAPLVRLPQKRPDIRGLVNLRGETVPVLNLEHVWGQARSAKYMVICERDNHTFAFEVDEAREVLLIPQGQLMPIAGDSRSETVGMISQVAQVGNRKLLMFELQKAIAA